jgi:UPF0755 protein
VTKRVVGLLGLLLVALFIFIGYRAVSNVGGWALPSSRAQSPQPSPNAADTATIVVAKGDNARSIGDKLQKSGVVRSGTWFRMLAEIEGVQNDLAAGSYVFQKDSDTQAALDRIKVGILEPQVLVTVPEGLRLEQVSDLLGRAGVYDAQALTDAMKTGSFGGDLLKDRPAGTSLEGYIFPDTYYFPLETTPEAVVNEMLAALNDRFDPTLRAASQTAGLSTYQVLTLASIVEREAQTPAERPIIASVYLNRLEQSIPLQADPTVQYAVAQDPASVSSNGWWKRDLTEDDLKIDSAYNTYQRQGLPPGPICNPGRAAIDAVLHPAQTNFLYFVAKGDGSHAFATTLAEHNANVQKYQKR